MKYLGIDYGTKRIGLALSDEMGSFAFPKTIVHNDTAMEEIISLLEIEKNVAGIVVGYSVASNGTENDVAKKALAFKEKLMRVTVLPVFFEREDFSSVEAHRYQIKKGPRDDSAAAIILQRYLDRMVDKQKEA